MNLLIEQVAPFVIEGTDARKVAAYSAWLTLTREAELTSLKAHNALLRAKQSGLTQHEKHTIKKTCSPSSMGNHSNSLRDSLSHCPVWPVSRDQPALEQK